jgi:hypothetical protein
MLDTSETYIPLTLINYPRLVRDSFYLYKKLEPVLINISQIKFDSVFKFLIRPDWIHDFIESK